MNRPTDRPPNEVPAATELTEHNRGASVGFIVLTVVIGFVAYWMATAGRQAVQPDRNVTLSQLANIAGFNDGFWQLPDDALLGFTEIPAGEFLMGSDPVIDRLAYENERWSESTRRGSVTLPRYYIGRFEVTVAQYRQFVAATGHASLPETLTQDPTLPVTNVTWTDALAYSRWLQSELLDHPSTPSVIRQLLESGWRITLPSEAEWEKAARGADGDIYPWGNGLLENRANFNSDSLRPVGSFPCEECKYGLADMSGNVWELTRSPLLPYPFTEDFGGRIDLAADPLFVMRGGSYADGPANIRAAVRGGVDPGVRSDTIGFRLVLSSQ